MSKFGEGRLVGIDSDYGKDALIGIGAGLLFIMISVIAPGIAAIGFPVLPQAIGATGLFLIIVIAAPIFETVIFQDLILDFFDSKLKIFGKKALPFFIAVLLASMAFSIYHLTAYGGSLTAAKASFVSVIIAGIGFSYLRFFTNSILPTIIAHAIINAYLLYGSSVVIS